MNPIDPSKLPKHVAIIMDGNGRWAKERGLDRIEGHRRGMEAVDDIIGYARELGVQYLTVYAFSKENWNRPQLEVDALMLLLKEFLVHKRQKMLDNQIALNAIGDLSLLPQEVQETLFKIQKETSVGKEMVLTLALSYGARDEIVRAVNKIIACRGEVSSPIREQDFSSFLDTKDMPDVDLVIRTSGEHRISNFLLWQGAYAEYLFEESYWPDFSREHFLKALCEFQTRERRYGKTSEQLK